MTSIEPGRNVRVQELANGPKPMLSQGGFSTGRACRALGLADISIERIAVAWPWLTPDSALSRQLGRALPDFASVYILSARKRGVRARPVTRALDLSASTHPALKTAGLTQRGASND